MMGYFLLATASRPDLGVRAASYPMGTGGLLPPSSAEVKNAWSCTSAPQYVFMARYLFDHRDNFTFFFLPFIDLVCH
jgi:hypothetical protein